MPAVSESRYMVTCAWSEVPHIDEQTQRELLASTPPYLRDARSKGIPSLGSGAIYPVSEDKVTCDPFPIPAHFRRGYGFDVGWNRTAAAFGAYDPDAHVLYVNAEHYLGEAFPSTHTTAIRARGDWLPGFIDPAARGRSQDDGERLLVTYRELGLHLMLADNSVEAGLLTVWQMLETGRLKFFRTCQNLLSEYRIYRRDEKGHIVKKFDHLMDALRYLVMSIMHMITKPIPRVSATGRSADRMIGY